MRDEERKSKVQAWIKNHMGSRFHPVWKTAVDHLDRVTVRGNYVHGEDASLREDSKATALPLICIGDSLLSCGLGGGGILAMQDTIELADVLTSPGFFGKDGSVDVSKLRAAEPAMLERKVKFTTDRRQRQAVEAELLQREDKDASKMSILDVLGVKDWKLRLVLPPVFALWKVWYNVERWWYGSVGLGPEACRYPLVEEAVRRK